MVELVTLGVLYAVMGGVTLGMVMDDFAEGTDVVLLQGVAYFSAIVAWPVLFPAVAVNRLPKAIRAAREHEMLMLEREHEYAMRELGIVDDLLDESPVLTGEIVRPMLSS